MSPKPEFVYTSEDEINDEKLNNPDYDLIAEKLLISRFVTPKETGIMNLTQSLRFFYLSLYHPEELQIQPSKNFPDMITTFTQEIQSDPEIAPSEEEFVKRLRKLFVREIDYGEFVTSETREQLMGVMENSEQTVIWTEGDNLGLPENDLPGSHEQLHKLANARVYNEMRHSIALERGVTNKDVLSVVAAENKMEFIPEISESFQERGINTVVVVEDRLKNLIKACELIKQHGDIDVFPVWIRQGEYKDSIPGEESLEECVEKYHGIDNISGLLDLLNENQIFSDENKVGSIFDLDGVLSDDEKRKTAQAQLVIKTLKENSWL